MLNKSVRKIDMAGVSNSFESYQTPSSLSSYMDPSCFHINYIISRKGVNISPSLNIFAEVSIKRLKTIN